MARSDPQVNIRMPLDLKELLEAAAKKSGRSLNSEILRRLNFSFSPNPTVIEKDIPLIRVILDSRGYPLSWDEIHEHLRAIQATIDKPVVSYESSIVTPDLVSSRERQAEAHDLRKYYSDKTAILKGLVVDAPEPKGKDFVWPTPKPRTSSKKNKP